MGYPSSSSGIDSTPIDYFNSMITPTYHEHVIIKISTVRATIEDVGNSELRNNYFTFKPFTAHEVDKFLGLLVLNGWYPNSQVYQWFLSPEQCHAFGNRAGHYIFKLGVRRYREFKHFLCVYNVRVHLSMS